VETPAKLTVTQLTAIQAVQAVFNQAMGELGQAKAKADQAQGKLQLILTECGLDPARNWKIAPDGTVEEQPAPKNRMRPDNAGSREGVAVPVAPAQNGRDVGNESA
jgi:hypothetical protein